MFMKIPKRITYCNSFIKIKNNNIICMFYIIFLILYKYL